MSIFAFCAFLPREFERNRTLSKKTIYRLRKFLGWCIIKLKIRLRIFLYTPVLCLWSSDDRYYDEEFDKGKSPAVTDGWDQETPAGIDREMFDRREAVTADRRGEILHGAFPFCCIHWIPVYFHI